MEVFTGLKPKGLQVQPTPMSEFSDCDAIEEEKSKGTIQANEVHIALEALHKEVADNNMRHRTKSQRVHSAKANFIPINFHIGDFVMIHPTHPRCHQHNGGWIGPMRIIKAKSDLIFVAKDVRETRKETVHAQRIMPYKAMYSRDEISKERLEYGENWIRHCKW